MNGERYPLEWIDDYVARLRDYIFVREEDNLLIKVPNVAHKLNPSGIRLLKRLMSGTRVVEVWNEHGRSEEVRRDLYEFFVALKQVLQGCANEHCLPEAVDVRPFALSFNTLPVLSEVALTYRCNLSCRFCYAGCSCHKKDGEEAEMTTNEVKRVLRTIREDAKVPSVSFTGGEPTLRDDLPEIIYYARRTLGMRVNLITNGTLIDAEKADELADAGLNSAQLSMESPEEGVHDALTQVEGSWRATLAAVALLKDRGISVHTNTTLNRANVDSASALPEFVRSLGLERFSVNLVIPAGSSQQPASGINLRYTEIPEFVLILKREAARNGVEFMWYSPTPTCIFNPIPHQLGNKGCAACDGLISVSPTGDVLPCSSWPEPVGSLLREEFTSVWESARGRWLRQKQFAPSTCQSCDDFALCQGACPLYWRHFGFDEIVGKEKHHVPATV